MKQIGCLKFWLPAFVVMALAFTSCNKDQDDWMDDLQPGSYIAVGTVQKAELKEYKNQQGGMVTLFDEKDARLQFMLAGKMENIKTGDFFFTPVDATDSTLTMRLLAANGGTVDFNYRLLPHSYMVNLEIKTQGLEGFFLPSIKTARS